MAELPLGTLVANYTYWAERAKKELPEVSKETLICLGEAALLLAVAEEGLNDERA